MAADKSLYGVIHVPPLPGTPFYRSGSFPESMRHVVAQAAHMREGGLDGVLLQTADRVYGVEDHSDPARVAAMTLLTNEVVEHSSPNFAVGVQIMRHAVSASLAVAKLTGSVFVRVDALVGATLSTQGWVTPDPLSIMSYRRTIEADEIVIVADVDSMHYRWPDARESTGGVAQRALNVGADAVCIADPDDGATLQKIADVRRCAPGARVFLGGHVSESNGRTLLDAADGAFLNRCLMFPGDDNRVDPERVRMFVDMVTHG